ncbi:MAG: protein translocase subunit SecF [Armatimonadetes bacterium]|nr:protein translocase subunit SecF [Armatimonadota bacterium]
MNLALNFSQANLINMLIALIIMLGMCIWAESFHRKTYNIIGLRKWFFGLSLLLMGLGIFSLFTKGLNLGLDFTGGTIFELGFHNKIEAESLRTSLKEFDLNLGDAVIQLEEGEKNSLQKVLIRVKKITGENLKADKINNLVKYLENKFGKIEVYKTENIGPVIGEELKQKALIALIIALVSQLIYITFRFGNQMRYGLAADIAMAHDIIIMVGLYSLFGKQADSPFLAALLTVIGYSVMDSIVIFDRIRENLKLFKKGVFEEIVNVSINQTMTRSINTLMTCLITVVALYFLGGSTLKNFAFALLIGLTSGAYSSIFIASPLLVILDNYLKKKEKEKVLQRRLTLEKQAENPNKIRTDSSPLEENYPAPEEFSASSSSPKLIPQKIKRKKRRK